MMDCNVEEGKSYQTNYCYSFNHETSIDANRNTLYDFIKEPYGKASAALYKVNDDYLAQMSTQYSSTQYEIEINIFDITTKKKQTFATNNLYTNFLTETVEKVTGKKDNKYLKFDYNYSEFVPLEATIEEEYINQTKLLRINVFFHDVSHDIILNYSNTPIYIDILRTIRYAKTFKELNKAREGGNVTNIEEYYRLNTVQVSSVTSMRNLFQMREEITFLDLSNWDTNNVTNMEQMLRGCYSLASLNVSGFNTNHVITMAQMFSDCSALTSLDLSSFHTSHTNYMGWMFEGCKSLTSLDISNFDFSNVKNITNIFVFCDSLSNLKFGKNLDLSIKLDSCPLTHESVLSVINGLAQVEKQQVFFLTKKTYNTLSKEEIKMGDDKNWLITADINKFIRSNGNY